MTMNEKRIRQIIREEAARALAGTRARRRLRENDEDDRGRWVAGHNGYELHDVGSAELEAWSQVTAMIDDLADMVGDFAHEKYEDTESPGEMVSFAEMAAHQLQLILSGR